MDYNSIQTAIASIPPGLWEQFEAIWQESDGSDQERLVRLAHLAHGNPAAVTVVRLLIPHILPNLIERLAVYDALEQREGSDDRDGSGQQRTPEPPAPRAPEPQERGGEIRIDPEVARLAVALHFDSHLRIWAILKKHAGSRGGHVHQDVVLDDVTTRRDYTRRHLARLLEEGRGLLWRRAGDELYLVGGSQLARALTQRAAAAGIDVSHLPGRRDMYIPIGGSIQEFRGHIMGAWLASHNNPRISQARLGEIFGRTARTIYNWLLVTNRVRSRTQYNQALVDRDNCERLGPALLAVSNHPTLKRTYTWEGTPIWTWRGPNTYHASYRESATRGRAHKRRTAVTDTSIPRDICRAGKDRLYWSTAEQLRRAVKRDKATLGLVWRGEDKRGRGVWELSTGDPATGPNSVARGAVARRHIANWWAAYRQRQEKYNRTFSSDYLMRESLSPTDGGWMGAPVVRGGGGPGGGGD